MFHRRLILGTKQTDSVLWQLLQQILVTVLCTYFATKEKKWVDNCNFGYIIWIWKRMINCSTCYCRYHKNVKNHNNIISLVKYCDNIMEYLGDSHLYCWWSVVREWIEELLITACGVISGLHCIPDWNGGVWAAGVETSHGGIQQVQVRFNITALCFLFFLFFS